MPRPNPVADWTQLVTDHFPHLSKPQAAVLALWSFGMVLARSCGLTAVATALVPLLDRPLNTLRERLRDWYKGADDKSGDHRRQLDTPPCFAPLLRWILTDWPCPRVAVALDATSLFDRLTVLSLSVVYRGTAIPVAWKVLRANVPHPWEPEWKELLQWFHDRVDPAWTVVVLTDRGLYAPWLFQAIVALGWHPMMRITRRNRFQPEGWVHHQPVWWFASQVGRRWQGRGVAFPSTPESRLACTLLAYWSEGHEDGWYIITDLPPQVAEAAWYGLRMWIEHGFEQFKSAGWQWQKSRMTDPDRAGRIWLAMAVATLWVVSVGGQEEADDGLVETMPELPRCAGGVRLGPGSLAAKHQRRWESCVGAPRLVSVLRKGMAAILAALIMGRGVILGRWHPDPWPQIPTGIQVEHHAPNPHAMGIQVEHHEQNKHAGRKNLPL
jgi:hypothetical protein